MFARERLDETLKILNREGKVKVKALSNLFKVSQDCIRKDLNKLEREGKLQRTYGGAILPRKAVQHITLTSRKKENLNIKQKIAQKALEVIHEGETIFLGLSTTNILLAQLIADRNINLTVITNMIDVVKAFEVCENVEVICTGGAYNKDAGGFTGSETIHTISKYKFDKGFIGSCGVNVFDQDITTIGIEDGNTKKTIIHSGKKTYLLMENKKFDYDGIFKFASLNDIHTIITEEKPSAEICSTLYENGVTIL